LRIFGLGGVRHGGSPNPLNSHIGCKVVLSLDVFVSISIQTSLEKALSHLTYRSELKLESGYPVTSTLPLTNLPFSNSGLTLVRDIGTELAGLLSCLIRDLFLEFPTFYGTDPCLRTTGFRYYGTNTGAPLSYKVQERLSDRQPTTGMTLIALSGLSLLLGTLSE
jgi:hypothetical protein